MVTMDTSQHTCAIDAVEGISYNNKDKYNVIKMSILMGTLYLLLCNTFYCYVLDRLSLVCRGLILAFLDNPTLIPALTPELELPPTTEGDFTLVFSLLVLA